jgi:hypothetical protein
VDVYLNSPNTPSWSGAQLKRKSTGTTLPLLTYIMWRYCYPSDLRSSQDCHFGIIGVREFKSMPMIMGQAPMASYSYRMKFIKMRQSFQKLLGGTGTHEHDIISFLNKKTTIKARNIMKFGGYSY